MIRRGLGLLLALIVSGAPAALQMCGSHCVTPVSCHEATATDAQSAVQAGPTLCPHVVALGAVMSTKAVAPRPTIGVDAIGTVASHLFQASEVPTGARSIVRLATLSTHEPFVQQLRI